MESVSEAATVVPAPPDAVDVLRYARALAERVDSTTVHMEQLLWAIYAMGGASVQQAFADARIDEPALLQVLSRKKFTPPGDLTLREPATKFSGHALDAMTAAQKLAADGGRALTAEDLLNGVRSVDRCSLVIALHGVRPVTKSTLQMEDDDEIAADALDRFRMVDFADAIAGVIDQLSAGSLTIAITAPWGAGKTSLARLVSSRLTSKPATGRDRPHVVCWFNAWLHDGASDLAGAFAGELARVADESRPAWRRLVEPLPSSLLSPSERRRRRFLIVAFALSGLALSIWLRPVIVQTLASSLTVGTSNQHAITVTAALVAILGLLPKAFEWMNSATKALSAFVADPAAAAASGSMREVREQLRRLIKQATLGGTRFVVFVDDLERCTPPRPIDVLEAVNQLLSGTDTVTILIADLPAVAACADIKYKALADQNYDPDADRQAREGVRKSLSYGWLYLQKIVQLRFDVPPLTANQVARLLATQTPGNGPSVTAPPALWPWPAWPQEPRVWQAWVNTNPFAGVARALSIALWVAPLPGMVVRRFVERLMYPSALRKNVADRPYGLAPLIAVVVPTWLPVLWLMTSGRFQELARHGSSSFLAGEAQLPWWRFLLTGELLAILAIALIAAGCAGYRRVADRRLLAQVRDEIERNPAIAAGPAISPAALERLRQEFEFRKLSESALFAQAREEALKYLPTLPRSAKRLLNELRLMLYLCARRDLVQAGKLDGTHIGKWAAMRDRWPALARLVIARPDLVATLETAAKDNDLRVLSSALGKLIKDLQGDVDLRQFLGNEPALGPQIHRLVRYIDEPHEAEEAAATA